MVRITDIEHSMLIKSHDNRPPELLAIIAAVTENRMTVFSEGVGELRTAWDFPRNDYGRH